MLPKWDIAELLYPPEETKRAGASRDEEQQADDNHDSGNEIQDFFLVAVFHVVKEITGFIGKFHGSP